MILFLTGLYVFLGIVLFFFLVGLIAARIHILYDGKLKLYVTVLGFIKIRIVPSDKDLLNDPDYPQKKKEKIRKKLAKAKVKKAIKAKKKKEKEKKKKEAERKKKLEGESTPPKPQEKPKPKKKLTFKQIKYLLRLVLRVLKVFLLKFKKALRITSVKVKIKVASDDAAKTAYMYAAVSAGFANLEAFLYEFMNYKKVKKKNVAIYADFLSETIEADIHIVLRLRVGQVLGVAFSSLFAAIGYYIKHPMPKENGQGASTPSGHKVGNNTSKKKKVKKPKKSKKPKA